VCRVGGPEQDVSTSLRHRYLPLGSLANCTTWPLRGERSWRSQTPHLNGAVQPGHHRCWRAAAATQPGSPTGASGESARSQVKLIPFPPRVGLSDVDEVAASGRSDALAVGQTVTSRNFVPLLDRWNGSGWHKAALPAPVATVMGPESLWSAVTADASGSMWVFGQDAAVLAG